MLHLTSENPEPFALRVKYDELMDLADQEIGRLTDEQFLTQSDLIRATLAEAMDLARQLEGEQPGMLQVLTMFDMATLSSHLGSISKDRSHHARAFEVCDEGLRIAVTFDPPAPLVEALGLAVRGGLFAQTGNLRAGIEHLEEVVTFLEPHVAHMHEVLRSGSEAERFACVLMDRRFKSMALLTETRLLLLELRKGEAAVRMLEEMVEPMLSDASAAPPPSLIQKLQILVGFVVVCAIAWLAAGFTHGIVRLVAAAVGVLLLLGVLGALWETIIALFGLIAGRRVRA